MYFSIAKNKVRCSKQSLQELLDENFMEFCSSGRVYIYDINTVIDEEVKGEWDSWRIIDFRIKNLSQDCILATYRFIKENQGQKKCSLRSSIWRNIEQKWKMIFHQGTLINE